MIKRQRAAVMILIQIINAYNERIAIQAVTSWV